MWVIQVCVKINHVIAFLFQKSPSCMEPDNDTQILEFLLLGLSEEVKAQPLIFGLFLSTYLITAFGNLLIILAITSDAHLHTPMYFFLSNLSFVDICFTSTTIPKMLWNIWTHEYMGIFGMVGWAGSHYSACHTIQNVLLINWEVFTGVISP